MGQLYFWVNVSGYGLIVVTHRFDKVMLLINGFMYTKQVFEEWVSCIFE